MFKWIYLIIPLLEIENQIRKPLKFHEALKKSKKPKDNGLFKVSKKMIEKRNIYVEPGFSGGSDYLCLN